MTRLIPLEGPVNVRDIGDGERVRAGRIFRGDSIDDLSAADAAMLFEELGIRTVVDLRSEAETTRVIARDGVRRHHTPVAGGPGEANPMLDTGATDLRDHYRDYLDNGSERVIAALRAVITACDQPVLLHCAAGKDRTGVISAFLQSLLGVPVEEIVEAYAFSATRMEQLFARLFAAHPEYVDRFPTVLTPIMTAVPETMERLLEDLDVEQWCLEHGLTAGEIERLRAELLL